MGREPKRVGKKVNRRELYRAEFFGGTGVRRAGMLAAWQGLECCLCRRNLEPVPAFEPGVVKSAAAGASVRRLGLRPREVGAVCSGSLLILAASYLGWWSIGVIEAWGFATGIICVWLVVREHLWNWPIGLANNVFFFALFFHSRLYADMGLQAVYLGLGIYGWWNWIYGGAGRTALKVSRTTRREWWVLLAAIPLGTWALREVLIAVGGAAPFWDSLTTVLSFAAQYLLSSKRL